jgi:hypothetical protein
MESKSFKIYVRSAQDFFALIIPLSFKNEKNSRSETNEILKSIFFWPIDTSSYMRSGKS